MPREVVQRLNAEIVSAMAPPEVKQKFLSFGTDAATGTPEELGHFIADEVAKSAASPRTWARSSTDGACPPPRRART